MSLSLYLLHAAQRSDLGCPNCVSVSSPFGRDYSAKCHRDLVVSLFFLFKGSRVSSAISSILRRCVPSLHPHTQHLCVCSHLCREVGEEFVPVSGVERRGGCRWVRRENEQRCNPLSSGCLIIFVFFGTLYVSKCNVGTPAILARCDKNWAK